MSATSTRFRTPPFFCNATNTNAGSMLSRPWRISRRQAKLDPVVHEPRRHRPVRPRHCRRPREIYRRHTRGPARADASSRRRHPHVRLAMGRGRDARRPATSSRAMRSPPTQISSACGRPAITRAIAGICSTPISASRRWSAKARLNRIVPGHDMELFRRLPNWIAGSNPVAEVHLAAGQKSFIAAR